MDIVGYKAGRGTLLEVPRPAAGCSLLVEGWLPVTATYTGFEEVIFPTVITGYGWREVYEGAVPM